MNARRGGGGWPSAFDGVVAVVAVALGVAASMLGLHPTGSPVADRVLVIALVTVTTWLGAQCSPAVIAAVAAALGIAGLGDRRVALGCFICLCYALVAARAKRWTRPGAAVLSGGLTLFALQLPEVMGFGSSALVAGVAIVVLSVGGIVARGRSTVRWSRFIAIWVVEVALIVAGAVVGTGIRMRDDLRSTDLLLRAALESVRTGDLAAASQYVSQAHVMVERLDDAAGSLAFGAGTAIPVLGQHVSVIRTLASEGRALAGATDDLLRRASATPLRSADGGIDLGTVRSITDTLDGLAGSLARFDTALGEPSPWLLPGAARRIRELDTRAADSVRQVRRIEVLAPHLDGLLGGQGVRRYFVAFLTPAEARPLGGYLGSFAEVEIENGSFRMTRFGRIADLIALNTDPATTVLDGPAEYLYRYGPYGLPAAGKPATNRWWLQVSISPDFPSVASVIRQLYTQGSGRPIDGVIMLDPSSIADLLLVTGPVDLPEVGRRIDATNAEDYLEREQYEALSDVANDSRIDALETVARTTFDRLASGAADPLSVLQALAPGASGRHVAFWSARPDEQQAVVELGFDGSFALPGGAPDALTVRNANGGPNKIDAYLHRDIDYRATIDPETGKLTGHVTLTLTNTATSALPDYAAGNADGSPKGTNTTVLSLYSAHEITGATIDGAPVEPSSVGEELGWHYYEQVVSIGPDASLVVDFDVAGRVDPKGAYALWTDPQPTVNPDHWEVSVSTTDGATLLDFSGVPASAKYLVGAG